MPPATLPGLLDRVARRHPNRPALAGGHHKATRWVLSWSGLRDRVAASGRRLAEAGAGPREAVAVAAADGPRRLLAELGAREAGAPLLPLRPDLPGSQAQAVLDEVKPALAVVDGEDGSQGDLDGIPTLALEDLPDASSPGDRSGDGEPLEGGDPTGPAVLLPTGWGEETEVLALDGEAWTSGIQAAAEALSLDRDRRALQAAPPTHVPARVAGTLAPLAVGASVAFAPRAEAAPGAGRGTGLLDAARRTDADVLAAGAEQVCDAWRAGAGGLGPVETVLAAGDPLPETAQEELPGAAEVVEVAGPPETGPVVACGPREAGGLPPVPGLEAGEGEAGIRVRGPGAPGEAADGDGWMATGWSGTVSGDGHVSFEGRLRDRIPRGDGGVAAEGIEAALRGASPLVARAVAFPAEGEAGAAVVPDRAQVPGDQAGGKTLERVASAAARAEPGPDRVALLEDVPWPEGIPADHAAEPRRAACGEEWAGSLDWRSVED